VLWPWDKNKKRNGDVEVKKKRPRMLSVKILVLQFPPRNKQHQIPPGEDGNTVRSSEDQHVKETARRGRSNSGRRKWSNAHTVGENIIPHGALQPA
jgi:hypothetical protein